MKKITSIILATLVTLGLSSTAFADPYQINISVTPDLGAVYNAPLDIPVDTSSFYVLGLDKSTHNPALIQLNSGFTGSGDAVNVGGITIAGIDGLSDIIAELRGDFSNESASLAAATSSINGISGNQTVFSNMINSINLNLSNASTSMLVTSSLPGFMLPTDKVKLDALSTSTITQVQSDWSQSSTTTVSYVKNKPSLGISYEGTTQRTNSFPIFKSATVASGVAVFYLTTDGTSGGTALFPNGVIQDSVNAFVSDATASYQMSYTFTNSNKTVTVTTNKLTTSNILTGILGQAAANGSVIKLSVWGY